MAVLALIELTTPGMVGGLALLSLPFIAHLMNRRARRRIVFPTIQLLRASAATQSKLYRLRRWLVLLLRCLAVAMIALAFARPVWLDASSVKPSEGDSVAAVVLIDTSASTGQQSGGVTLIHELRSAAMRTLDSLKAGTDTANIVYASSNPRASFPRMSTNLPALRAELEQLNPSFERTNFSQAAALAGQLLATHDGRRQLVVLSDLQQSNWQDFIERDDLSSHLPAGTQVTVIDLPRPPADNVGLSSPRQFPSQALINQPTQLVVHASNYSEGTKQVRVEAIIDGTPLANETVSLAPGEQRDVAFETVITSPGGHEVSFEIPTDGLSVDNRVFLVVAAKQRIPVVLVSDDHVREPGTASYFLTRALAPHGDKEPNRYEVRHVSSRQLSDASLAGASAVFVGYLGELGVPAAEALVKFVKGGGGVLYFCGEGGVRSNLAVLQKAAKNELVPWEPTASTGLARREDTLRITGGKWQSPLLRDFDEQCQIVISQIQFRKLWTAGVVAPDADVLLNFSDGTPALAARQFGAGQFVLANFSPALAASDLGKYGTFVALVQILAKQLSPAVDESLEAIAGRPYRHPQAFDTKSGGAISAIGPDGKSVPIVVNAEPSQITVQLLQTNSSGFYRFMRDNKAIGSAAINVDPREHNLRRIGSSALLQEFKTPSGLSHVQSSTEWKPLPDLHGRPLWGWFFALAMSAIGLELVCLAAWKR